MKTLLRNYWAFAVLILSMIYFTTVRFHGLFEWKNYNPLHWEIRYVLYSTAIPFLILAYYFIRWVGGRE